MASSPYDDNAFATANTFTNVLHSTPQHDNSYAMNLDYDQFPDPLDNGSQGSADMSIELGRGHKRTALHQDDVSSNATFNFGNEKSQYEVTGTPLRPRATPRKSDGTLRKETSLRRATESARGNDAGKRNVSGAKKRVVSDAGPQQNTDNRWREGIQPTATFQVRGSRFSRQVSSTYAGLPNRFSTGRGLQLGQDTPEQRAAGSANVHSATNTAQSFMLPDIPDITELVIGVQQHGPPVARRGPVLRTRFVPTAYRPQPLPDIPVTAMPVPDEEKAIYAGIQLLHEKNVQLEAASSEAIKRAEEHEQEIADLQGQLNAKGRRPRGAAMITEEEDTIQSRIDSKQSRLQAKVKSLQDQLDKAERKTSVSDITVSRIAKERDALIAQIGNAYYNSEELTKENNTLRDRNVKLQEENEDLKKTVERLQREMTEIQSQRANYGVTQSQRRSSSGDQNTQTGTCATGDDDDTKKQGLQHIRQRSKGEGRSRREPSSREITGELKESHRQSSVQSERPGAEPDLASRIEREVQRYRDEAAAKARSGQNCYDEQRTSTLHRVAMKSVTENQPAPFKRNMSAPVEATAQERESTRVLSATRQNRRRSDTTLVSDKDLTELSDLNDFELADLRRKLEAERHTRRTGRLEPSNLSKDEDGINHSAARQALPRKSSLKDLTSRTDNGTGRLSLHGETIDDIVKSAKTVRVQSPHSSQMEPEQPTSQAGDQSFLSNTSRRRRRAESEEGMTSAFIIPDITLHTAKTLPSKLEKVCIHHSAAGCTLCTTNLSRAEICMAIPVTDREGYGDETSATIRPAQDPAVALAIVIKNLQDEIIHLKIQREVQNRMYNQHDPAISKRRREGLRRSIDELTTEIEKRSDQVYKLHDVLEGQKQAAQLKANGQEAKTMDEQELEDTLQSLGIDPAELSGTTGRKAPAGLDGADDSSEAYSDELPWEGLSDIESDAGIRAS